MSKPSPLGNLIWIDLEMSGLDARTDVILEIVLIITDGQLNILHEGPHLIIHHDEEVLKKMDPWVRGVHTKSGLLDAAAQSKISTETAKNQVLETIKQFCKPNTASLAGNSIWQDRIFLQRYMPEIVDYLYYRMIDVTSIKELIARWYPQDPHIEFEKADTHRALTDIRESIEELAHYRKYFFKFPRL